jgi:hypothetical protein
LEVLFIALGDISWFNISTGFFSNANGLISTFTCHSEPQIYPLLEVIEFDFFKIISVHFRKFHHHTRHSTLIWAPSALLYYQPLLHPATTRRSVFHTRQRLSDNPALCVMASTAFYSYHWSTVVLCFRHAINQCFVPFFFSPSLLLAVKVTSTMGVVLTLINVFFARL